MNKIGQSAAKSLRKYIYLEKIYWKYIPPRYYYYGGGKLNTKILSNEQELQLVQDYLNGESVSTL